MTFVLVGVRYNRSSGIVAYRNLINVGVYNKELAKEVL